jgi:hypothetical protein
VSLTWIAAYRNLMPMAEELRRRAIEITVELARRKAEEEAKDRSDKDLVVRKAVAKARAAAEAAFGDIPARFLPFSQMPDPAGFTAAIDDLRKAAGSLVTVQGPRDPLSPQTMLTPNDEFAKAGTADDYLARWDGDAARAFKQNFLDPFPFHTAAQFNVAVILRGAIEAEQAVWQAARADVALIAQEGIEALDRIGSGCDANEWTIGFTVVAAVAFVGAAVLAVPTAGASVAATTAVVASIGLTAVGSAASVAAVMPPGEPEPIQFSGETPVQVVDEVMRGLSTLVDRIGQQEARIASALYADYSIIQDNWSSFVSRRPALAGATPANVTTDEFLGRPG